MSEASQAFLGGVMAGAFIAWIMTTTYYVRRSNGRLRRWIIEHDRDRS